MNTSESFDALRRANPRFAVGFARLVEATADATRARIATAADTPVAAAALQRRGRLNRLVAVGAALATAAGVAALTVGSHDGPGVENAVAAVRQAATVTAAAAERSGTAVVRITHSGEVWAGSTIRWHDGDLAVSRDALQRRGKAGTELLVVNGTVYGVDSDRWVVLGRPANIDPGSGTTPDEYLAAVRADVGGVTLRRIAAGVTGLTTSRLDGGSTVYRSTVAAGLIAKETGFKEGRSIRVLPFGYVAHGEAANAAAPLDVAVTVGADGIIREIAVTWGAGADAWRYVVSYGRLGATSALVAPSNARPLRERLRSGRGE